MSVIQRLKKLGLIKEFSNHKKSESWKEAFYKVDFVKIEDFCSMNDTVKKMKRHHRLVGSICKTYIVTKCLSLEDKNNS